MLASSTGFHATPARYENRSSSFFAGACAPLIEPMLELSGFGFADVGAVYSLTL